MVGAVDSCAVGGGLWGRASSLSWDGAFPLVAGAVGVGVCWAEAMGVLVFLSPVRITR
jgi:hypothetical protein